MQYSLFSDFWEMWAISLVHTFCTYFFSEVGVFAPIVFLSFFFNLAHTFFLVWHHLGSYFSGMASFNFIAQLFLLDF